MGNAWLKGILTLIFKVHKELKSTRKRLRVRTLFKIPLISLLWLWVCGALRYLVGVPFFIVAPLIIFLPLVYYRYKNHRNHLIVLGAVIFVVSFILLVLEKPKRYRNWDETCRKPPVVRISNEKDVVTISNVRHFKWQTPDDYQSAWVKKSYYLDKLNSLDLIIEPLEGSDLFAHTMLSFGFGTEERVVVSAEARKEKGEKYSIFSGIYKQFELLYQISSERDALTLRVARGQSKLFIYPVKATPDFIRSLFLSMTADAGRLVDEPIFYHSLRANCTTELFKHIKQNFDGNISYGKGVLFPAQAGEVLHEMGWMKTELDYEAARKKFMSSHRVKEFADDPHFSRRIRGINPDS